VRSGYTIAVTNPAVVRSAIVPILDAPASAFWPVDIPPLTLTDRRLNGRACGCICIITSGICCEIHREQDLSNGRSQPYRGVVGFGSLNRFDEFIAGKGYETRSEAFRDLIRDRLGAAVVIAPNALVVGTVTLIYDHHTCLLSERLTGIQHRSHQVIISTRTHRLAGPAGADYPNYC
jgi:hypothetical protein